MGAERPILTFDLDGVLCRPPFGINPGRNIGKARKSEGRRTFLSPTEPYRYYLRRPMAGAREGFAWLNEPYDCQVLTARTEHARRPTEGWLKQWLGFLPVLHLRTDYDETPAAYKARRSAEIGALAHFEDDPHTALWVAESVPAVFLVDWWRNRWLDDARIHRIRWIAQAGPILRTLVAEREASASTSRPGQSAAD